MHLSKAPSSTTSSYVCSSLPLTVLTNLMLLSARRQACFLCIKAHWDLSERVSWWESKKKKKKAFTLLQGWLVLCADERETATFKKAEQVKTRKLRSTNYRQVLSSKLLCMFNVYNRFCHEHSFTFWDLFSLYVTMYMCVFGERGDQRFLKRVLIPWGWWYSWYGLRFPARHTWECTLNCPAFSSTL